MANVVEVMVFNVEEAKKIDGVGDWASYYVHFTDLIRTKYFSPIEDIDDRYTDEYLDIVLQTHSHQSMVRIYMRYINLIGYQMGENGKWLESGHHHTWRRNLPPHRIPGSTFLEFTCSYDNLLHLVGDGQTLYTFLFGQCQLTTAVNLLATSSTKTERAWALLVVGVMICETIRSPSLSCYFASASSLGLTLSKWRPPRFHTREKNRVLSGFSTPYYQDREPYREVDAKRPGIQQLLEVFSLRIININGGKGPSNFFGTVYFKESWYGEPIYNGGRVEDTVLVSSGDSLLLTGPRHCIPSGCIDLGFKFVIFDKILPFDTEIFYSWPSLPHDVPLYSEFATDDCSLMMGSIVLNSAVQATVEVTINAVSKVYVYGSISAMFDDYEVVLFQKIHKEHLGVCPGEHLSLSRSSVAVPSESFILIHVDLYDYDEEFCFLNGFVEFPAQLSGSSQKIIHGDSCSEIVINVTWT